MAAMKEPRLLLLKSHVSAYTRKDGTFVAEHTDKRQAAKPEQPAGRKPHVTETANFNRWFGDSKVVDSDGKPLVVYHGTTSEFSEFDPKRAGAGNDRGMRGRGFYFSPNEKTSKGYGPVTMPVYLSIQKPFRPSDFSSSDEIADALGIDDGMFEFDPESGDFRVYQSFAGSLTSALKDAGYDGVIYGNGQEVIAFYPEQIKSADRNSGEFDPKSRDMTKAMVIFRR